jgi:S-adenosylmethionine:diacylglycerol 3-amino-3-carboxypropyl transferase
VACDINQAQIDYVKHRIGGGAREIGSAERVLGLMRALMPLAGWRRGKIGRFLELDNPDDQLGFWRAELDTWRFRAGLSLLLSPLSLGRMYSSTLLSSLPAHFAQVLRGRLERCFAHHPNRTNPYLRALLSPSSLSESAVPAAASTIDLVVDDAADYLERCAAGSFAGFALSNILDGVREPYRQRLFSAVRRAAAPEASVVLRSFAEPASELSTNQALRDRSLLWGVVDVRSVASL